MAHVALGLAIAVAVLAVLAAIGVIRDTRRVLALDEDFPPGDRDISAALRRELIERSDTLALT